MCDAIAPPTWSRRRALGLGFAGTLAAARALRGPGVVTSAATVPSVDVAPGLSIRPRTAWGSDLPARQEFTPETVKFLLIHHTATPNDRLDPRLWIRQVYAFHTSSQKGWGDVAYHFFVAPDGSVWEGRQGSLAGPVVADATGGNQGWAQLVCLIGNFDRVAPTAEAQDSLIRLLTWLRWRYQLPVDPLATIEYTSRGSNRHRAGDSVRTAVISAHRDASATRCPGDVATGLLPHWRQQVAAAPVPAFAQAGPHPSAQRGRRYQLD